MASEKASLAGRASLNEAQLAFLDGEQSRDLRDLARSRILQLGVPAEEADDLAQEVMVNMLRRLPDFQVERGTMEGWIVGFSRMVARSWARRRRKQSREVPVGLVVPEILEARPGPVASDELALALEKLGDADRELIRMRYGSGLNSRQIAEATGLTDAAVRKRLSRALERVRQDPSLREAFLE
ncbi:MAG: sigma-70 family RNA polymerase sigma factor [Fimbriimonas ginsengisoli]|uniref:Sigma-70 family RNA polymerase sigma factor n=1 Tax=Fimbriimonas ginsengisoli TaxID=1005039 RepID=A0A931LUU3_FIMGI|nr:sigma-70 family RNA polymerase sigma factor [Fimbriimonas ginsengisoli]